ncbi:MAG: NUDIX domain-containing protein [Patescibacteria group bacterium]
MEEYVDVLDEAGNLTGQKKLKSEVHRDGDWHRSIHLWIINSKRELLIQRRAAQKENHPNMWDIPSAGHISAGEDPITAALRETEEELGLKLETSEIEHLFTVAQTGVTNNGTFINNEFNDVYMVQKDIDISQLSLQEEEVAEVRFISFLELERAIESKDGNFVSHFQEYPKLFSELHRRFPSSK